MAAELTALDLDIGEDWEAAEVIQDALLEHFGEWMVAGERQGVEWAVAETLQFKDAIDGHFGWWRRGHLAEFLTELFPRKISADEANIALVVPTLRDFFTWLELTGLLDPDSDPLSALHDELERIEPELPGLMSDVSRYGLGKRMTAAMLADGVDVTDADAVQAWIGAYNARLSARVP
jgi:hypothetical protein